MKIKINSIIILAVVFIVIAAGFVFFVSGDKIITDTEFGGWREQIAVVYEDGSSTPLNVFSSLSVAKHGGKEVFGISYSLDAKNTMDVPITLQMNDYSVVYSFSGNSVTRDFVGDNPTVSPDGEYYNIISDDVGIYEIFPDGTPEESYTLSITPSGTITYSSDETVPKEVVLPNSASTTITLVADSPPPPPPSGNEDLTTYTHELDTSGYITLPLNDKAQFTNMPRGATCYLRKPYTNNNFNISFGFKITDVEWLSVDGPGGTSCMQLVTSADSTDLQKAMESLDGCGFNTRAYTSWTLSVPAVYVTGTYTPYLVGNTNLGQTFTISSNNEGNIYSVAYRLSLASGSSANVICDIYAVDSVTLMPTGSILTTATRPGPSTSAPTVVTWTFPVNQTFLTSGLYAAIIHSTGQYNIDFTTTDGYTLGQMVYQSGGNWQSGNGDCYFQVRKTIKDTKNILAQIRSNNGGSTVNYYKECYDIQLNTDYLVNLIKEDSILRCYIYNSDSTLLWSNLLYDNTTVNYFLPLCGRASGGTTILITGYYKDFKLGN